MRLGRVPLLGIDDGTTPSSFSSSEARQYAKEGNWQYAVLAEMLCELYKDRPDESDGLYHGWEIQVGMLASRFGADMDEALELIRAECDPAYTRNDTPEPEPEYVPPVQQASYTQPKPTYQQAPASYAPAPSPYQQTKAYPAAPARIQSGFSWNQLLSPFGSMWT